MAKTDLIGGALWEQYSSKVNQRMAQPQYFGELSEENAEALGGRLIVADHGAEACGDAIRLYLIVDSSNDRILDARFKTFGCGTAIAASDVMTEMCIGKTVDETLDITNLDVEHSLRDDIEKAAIPPQKMHCSVMAYDVIKRAVSLYKGIHIEELDNEEIVCECARVSLGTIREVIRLNDLHTVEEISNYTKAGAFCKSCIQPGGHEARKYYLVDILREVRAEMDNTADSSTEAVPKTDFAELNIIGKHKAIERLLDEEVRPLLAADGGSVEVTDIHPGEEQTEVLISYTGACKGCAGAETGTLEYIQRTLTQYLSSDILVRSV